VPATCNNLKYIDSKYSFSLAALLSIISSNLIKKTYFARRRCGKIIVE